MRRKWTAPRRGSWPHQRQPTAEERAADAAKIAELPGPPDGSDNWVEFALDMPRTKLHTVENEPGMLVFQCPACGNCHYALVEGATRQGPRWTWNGSMDRPTFSPSIKVTTHRWEPPVGPENIEQWRKQPWEQKQVEHICHFFVRDGKIEYCGDCTHDRRGQTIEVPDWD